VGYSIAALRKGRWLAAMAQVDVAVVLTVTIAGTLTPLLSPYRLAADSQLQRILATGLPPTQDGDARLGPMRCLHFGGGGYGQRRLQELARLRDHPDAEGIRTLAARVLGERGPF
jgi:hypothetical protein